MRHIQIDKGGSIYTRTLQILAYADDVNLIGRSTGWLNDANGRGSQRSTAENK